MSGKKPWGWEGLQIGEVVMARGLYGWYHLLRMTKQKRVAAKVIAEAVDDSKGEGLQPCGAALGVGSEDDVFGARFEAIFDTQSALDEVRTKPVVFVEHQWLRPPLSCWEFGYKICSLALE